MITLLRETKFRVATYRIQVKIYEDTQHYYIKAPYNKALIAELKLMQGAKWMGYDLTAPTEFKKTWRVNKSSRNNFTFAFLEELKPYAKYNTDLQVMTKEMFSRPLYDHQIAQVSHGLQRRQCELSCEMGTGKTLASIEIIERSGTEEWWFVGTKSSLTSVRYEFALWKAKVYPEFLTYDELKKRLRDWVPGTPAPMGVIFDESSKVKTPSSQRSQCAFELAESMRREYGDKAYIILMSGSPAPKSPADWYWQVEVACPGFFPEGNIDKFKHRMAVIEQVDGGADRVSFPKLVAWRDGNPNLCNSCGREKSSLRHEDVCDPKYHAFEPMKNEVADLYRRMKGLVLVQFKKDCLDLPDKIYRQVKVKPTFSMLNAAKLVLASSKTAIEALTRMRELSDGFQYKETPTAKEICTLCKGAKVKEDEDGKLKACDFCNGTGDILTYIRETLNVESPKLEALTDELDLLEEEQRVVVYAGFTASIDRTCQHVHKLGWDYIRVDGRGWHSSFAINCGNNDAIGDKLYRAFQDKANNDKKIAFVAHPGSAGMGLTLTASPVIIYYSNDFNAEYRIQSEDRIHRPGMDTNKGATIIDLICLPSDLKVLDNLKKKRDLQSMSLGEVKEAMECL